MLFDVNKFFTNKHTVLSVAAGGRVQGLPLISKRAEKRDKYWDLDDDFLALKHNQTFNKKVTF